MIIAKKESIEDIDERIMNKAVSELNEYLIENDKFDVTYYERHMMLYEIAYKKLLESIKNGEV